MFFDMYCPDYAGCWQYSTHAKSLAPSNHRHSCGHSRYCLVALRLRNRFRRAAGLRLRTILGSDYQHLPDPASGGRLCARSVLEPVVQYVPAAGSALATLERGNRTALTVTGRLGTPQDVRQAPPRGLRPAAGSGRITTASASKHHGSIGHNTAVGTGHQ